MTDFPITLFHNPACGTSRNVLDMIRSTGRAPEVIEYAAAGWTEDQLRALFAEAGLSPRQALREKEAAAAAPALLNPDASDEDILAAMIRHPLLVERPLVRTPKGAALCRPSERVFDLLDERPEQFVKEDGEVVRLVRD
ncbi:MAG TPA: arsenate reductase (glutaredoxin) [Brevundimonas sp.]|nr:arsenate reductase (glutaredoxin) [Brevundimonas sp.]